MKGKMMPDIHQQNTAHDVAAQEKLQQVQRNFGVAAEDYVTSKVHASGQDLDWVVEVAALSGTERVLDVATGAGHTAFVLAPYAAEVVALDITREMLAVALRNHGAEVEVVASAAEAMTALTDMPADVLISDISMPGEDGYSLIRRLRTEGGRIRAVALTALARVEDGERALAAGFQRCLAKPVDPAELATVVRALIRSG